MELRTQEQHLSDKTALEEALVFFADALERPPVTIKADVLSKDRSVYRIMDKAGQFDRGEVVKTRKLWVFTANGTAYRTHSVDLIAVKAL